MQRSLSTSAHSQNLIFFLPLFSFLTLGHLTAGERLPHQYDNPPGHHLRGIRSHPSVVRGTRGLQNPQESCAWPLPHSWLHTTHRLRRPRDPLFKPVLCHRPDCVLSGPHHALIRRCPGRIGAYPTSPTSPISTSYATEAYVLLWNTQVRNSSLAMLDHRDCLHMVHQLRTHRRLNASTPILFLLIS
jgi:hypothetical protein